MAKGSPERLCLHDAVTYALTYVNMADIISMRQTVDMFDTRRTIVICDEMGTRNVYVLQEPVEEIIFGIFVQRPALAKSLLGDVLTTIPTP